MSLKLITCGQKVSAWVRVFLPIRRGGAYIFMLEMFEQLEFSVGALGEDGGAEGLHDLLDGHRLAGQLVFCRAIPS